MRRRLARREAIASVAMATAIAACGFLRHRPAWELPPPPIKAGPVVAAERLHRVTLANGLRVLLLEDHGLPRVAIGVAARRGAGTEPRDRAGLAVFTSELMKRGAGARNALSLAEVVDEIGATLDARADWDSTTVAVTGLSRDIDRLTEVLGDVVLRPQLRSDEALKARAEHLAALERAKDQPATLVQWETMRVLYGDHRYGLPLRGTEETVSRLTAASAKAFHRSVFVPGDAILFAAGDLSLDDWISRAGKTFGPEAWPPSEKAPAGPPPPARAPESRRVVVVDRPDLGQARIVIAHEGLARRDDRRIAADVMNNVLGGSGFASRLMETVRLEAGLTYSVFSGFDLRRHPGPFLVSTFTRVPETRRVVELLLQGLHGIQDRPPDEDELLEAKSFAIGRFGLGLETSEAVLQALVSLDVYEMPYDLLDTYRSRVRDVTTADAARMARELVHPDRAAIVLLGPATTLVPLVEDLGPVEVVTP